MQIYGTSRSRAFRALWAADELGIGYEHNALDWRTCAEDADYLAVNPAGTIPCLVHNDFVLSESLAINIYLAESVSRLWPADRRDQAKVLQWTLWAQSSLEAPYITWATHTAWLPKEMRKPELASAAEADLERPLIRLEIALRASPWLVAGEWSIADLNVASVIPLLRSRDNGRFPGVHDWLRRCTDRPSFRTASARP